MYMYVCICTRAGCANEDIICLPRMPPSFQNLQIKAFSLGHEHTLALDRKGQVYCHLFVKVHKRMHFAFDNNTISNLS